MRGYRHARATSLYTINDTIIVLVPSGKPRVCQMAYTHLVIKVDYVIKKGCSDEKLLG